MTKATLAAVLCAAFTQVTALRAQDPKPYPPDQPPVFETVRPYPRFGLEANMGDQTGVGFGLRYEASLGFLLPRAPEVRFASSLNYFFPDGPERYWELNANVINMFTVRNVRANPYVGAGLNVATAGPAGLSSTEAGLNLLGGIRIQGRGAPYLETKLTLGGGSQFSITAGWLLW